MAKAILDKKPVKKTEAVPVMIDITRLFKPSTIAKKNPLTGKPCHPNWIYELLRRKDSPFEEVIVDGVKFIHIKKDVK